MKSDDLPALVIRDHQRLHEAMAACLDGVLALDFAAALACLLRFERDLARHIAAENTHLLPLLEACPSPRWGAHVYRSEHDKLLTLTRALVDVLKAEASEPIGDASSGRRRALALIDAAHPLRHVLEHHEQREEQGMLVELPHDPDMRARFLEALGER